MSRLLHHLITDRAATAPTADALQLRDERLSYAELAELVARVASGLLRAGLQRQERVAIYLPKEIGNVAAMFGSSAAGGVFVPVNPALKPAQVAHILKDCDVSMLITSPARYADLSAVLPQCPALRVAILSGENTTNNAGGMRTLSWQQLLAGQEESTAQLCIDSDMAAILYTSGSTGQPKGVVLSHRNMVSGAASVATYLKNRPADRILAVLPFSFDYGFSQLSTAFHSGACAVLMDYLLPRDVVRAVERFAITGLAAVPPLWIEIAALQWPEAAARNLRYISNSGGAMPGTTVSALQRKLPATEVYLMYGLTEAFRSTFLHPDKVAAKPGSIGQAIPNAEVLVLRPDGSRCDPGEAGELVHRGALVSLGYWNDAERTAERFRPLTVSPGLMLPEIAVFSGDTVTADEDGDLYFVGRRDDMIKTSGYRVSPTEVEEAAFASGLLAQAAAVGLPHPSLGQVVALAAVAAEGCEAEQDKLLECLRRALPGYMVPAQIAWHSELPRNPNGKIDRKRIALEWPCVTTEESS